MLYMFKDIIKTTLLSVPYGLTVAVALTLCLNKILKNSFKNYTELLNRRRFRLLLYTITYIFMLLYRTVLCRTSDYKPLENVWGGWGIEVFEYTGIDYGTLIGNILMFVPLTVITLFTFGDVFSSVKEMIIKCMAFSFCVSLIIELLQLIFHKGTFQISDIVYNTLGGLAGVGIYILIQTKIIGRKK